MYRPHVLVARRKLALICFLSCVTAFVWLPLPVVARRVSKFHDHDAVPRALLLGLVNFSAVGCDGTFAECWLRIEQGKLDIITLGIDGSELVEQDFTQSTASIPLRLDEIEDDIEELGIEPEVVPTPGLPPLPEPIEDTETTPGDTGLNTDTDDTDDSDDGDLLSMLNSDADFVDQEDATSLSLDRSRTNRDTTNFSAASLKPLSRSGARYYAMYGEDLAIRDAAPLIHYGTFQARNQMGSYIPPRSKIKRHDDRDPLGRAPHDNVRPAVQYSSGSLYHQAGRYRASIQRKHPYHDNTHRVQSHSMYDVSPSYRFAHRPHHEGCRHHSNLCSGPNQYSGSRSPPPIQNHETNRYHP